MNAKIAKKNVLVSVVMGSDSDLPVMSEATKVLDDFGIGYELVLTSAHRTPLRTTKFAVSAAGRGIKVIVVGAGAAAHLAGVIAAHFIDRSFEVNVVNNFHHNFQQQVVIVVNRYHQIEFLRRRRYEIQVAGTGRGLNSQADIGLAVGNGQRHLEVSRQFLGISLDIAG